MDAEERRAVITCTAVWSCVWCIVSNATISTLRSVIQHLPFQYSFVAPTFGFLPTYVSTVSFSKA